MKQEDRFFRLMHAVDDDLLEDAMQPVHRRRHVWIPVSYTHLDVYKRQHRYSEHRILSSKSTIDPFSDRAKRSGCLKMRIVRE